MTAIAIGVSVRIVLLSQAFGNPSVELSDEGEKNWSFGQLLSMLLLILPLILVVEVYRGEVKLVECAPANSHWEDGEAKPFRPNLNASETELIKR